MAYALAPLTPRQVDRARALDERYADLGLGLTDAHVVVLAEDHDADAVLTLDERRFRVVVPRHRPALRLLPADGSPARVRVLAGVCALATGG